MKRGIILIIICLITAGFYGQEGGRRSLPRTNIRAACTIPKITSNEAFRVSLSGVYDANGSFNLRVFDNFNVGVGYKNALFIINKDNQKLKSSVSTRLQVHDGFVRIGYDKMFTEKKGFYSFVINAGYSYNKYIAVQHKQDSLAGRYPSEFGAIFVRPEIGLNFLVEESFAFGVIIAYNWTMSTFSPLYNAFYEYDDYSKYKNKVSMGYLSFGFGFYVGLMRKKQ